MTKLIFEKGSPGRRGSAIPKADVPHCGDSAVPEEMRASSPPELPEVSELDVIRHYSGLAAKNIGVSTHFYPLGSCTMKYNPCINEEIASMRELTDIHPYQPEGTVQGALELMSLLEKCLCKITGMEAFTLQPAAGAHGEFTSMLMTKKWFELKREQRNVILVPDSSHGTNPASAAMSGFKVVHVNSAPDGTVDLEDLDSKLDERVACFMMTNPNTLGLFEKNILKIAEKVHGKGGLLYYDGANLNATLGIVRPGDAGFDFMHINLHKTFSTPHGGGGPGSGPVGARGALADCLPLPRVRLNEESGLYFLDDGNESSIGRVQAFYGNFLIMARALAYILSIGRESIKDVARMAVLNANYVLSRIKGAYEVPYGGSCMHEFVADASRQKDKGATASDICKRLLDLGFHAPTVYFPLIVHEALMIEPTETESKETLDEYADAMLRISVEIDENPEIVKNAPQKTPVKRLDDVTAARQPVLRYRKQ